METTPNPPEMMHSATRSGDDTTANSGRKRLLSSRRSAYEKVYFNEQMTRLGEALAANRLDLVDDLISAYTTSGPGTGPWAHTVQSLAPLMRDAIIIDNSDFAAKLMQRGMEMVDSFFRAGVEAHAKRCLTLFLKAGYDLNKPESATKPPVWTNSTLDREMTFWLVARGADLNAHAPYFNMTPMSFAVKHAEAALVFDYLTDPRFLVDVTKGDLLHYALDRKTKTDVVPVLTMLLDHGAPINDGLHARHLPSQNMFFFMPRGPPLHKAAEKGQLDAVRFLLERHADVSIRDTKGNTALFYAQKHGHAKVAEVLRQAMDASNGQHL